LTAERRGAIVRMGDVWSAGVRGAAGIRGVACLGEDLAAEGGVHHRLLRLGRRLGRLLLPFGLREAAVPRVG